MLFYFNIVKKWLWTRFPIEKLHFIKTSFIRFSYLHVWWWSKYRSKHIAYMQKHIFYVLLTVDPDIILVNNQLDAQFFMYVYFHSLHVSGSHVPIIRSIIISVRHLVYVTLCRWPSGMQVTCIPERITCIPAQWLHQYDTWFMSLYVNDCLVRIPAQSDINQVSHWIIISVRHLVYVTLCKWSSGMQVTCIPEKITCIPG